MNHEMEEVDELGLSEADYKLLRDEEDFVRGFDYSRLSGDTLNQNQLALGYGFTAGYQSALPKWVPIAEIPDEWKKETLLIAGGTYFRSNETFQSEYDFEYVTEADYRPREVSDGFDWRGENAGGHDEYYYYKPTHAMLRPAPPPPPKDNES